MNGQIVYARVYKRARLIQFNALQIYTKTGMRVIGTEKMIHI